MKVLVIKITFWILFLKKYKHEFLRFIESDRIYKNFKIKNEIPEGRYWKSYYDLQIYNNSYKKWYNKFIYNFFIIETL